MVSISALHSFYDRSFYSAHFMDAGLWELYVREVCCLHGYDYSSLSPGLPGSFPTFLAQLHTKDTQKHSKSVVVKFFGPLFNGAQSFKIERCLGMWLSQQLLPIHSPAILAEGQLDDDWYYLIFEHIPGVSIGQLRDQISHDERLSIAGQLGMYLHQLHGLSLPNQPEVNHMFQPAWDIYASFLSQQQANCFKNHRSWNDLPAHLLEQLEGFILPIEQLIDFSATPHLIHADLTADHLLGKLVNSTWQTLAIIDWGDAMMGNVLYELAALHIDLFNTDKYLLAHFLETYDLPMFFQQDFPRKALSTMLLHQFPMPLYVYAPYQTAKNLQELAEGLFSI